MKKLLLLATCIIASLAASSQITYMFSMPYEYVFHVHYEHAGNKLVRVDIINNQILIFGYNQVLYKTINVVPPPAGDNSFISYLSEDLFDTDPSNFEYVQQYSDNDPHNTQHIRIYREDGTLLFSRDTMNLGTAGAVQGGSVDNAIFERGNATLMRLSTVGSQNGLKRTEFYKLPGHIFNGLAPQENNRTENVSESNDLTYAFPNPSSTAAKIYYQLPQGITQANLIVYDMNGKAVQQFKVSDVFNYITVSTADLPQGTYTYAIETPNEIIKGKEMVVVH